jgi:hypothetical protein
MALLETIIALGETLVVVTQEDGKAPWINRKLRMRML